MLLKYLNHLYDFFLKILDTKYIVAYFKAPL